MIAQTAVVTGASRGIGLAVARALATRGHHVIGLARTPSTDSSFASFLSVDLSNPLQVAEVLKRVTQHRDVGILVNNAGISIPASIAETTREVFDAQVAINMHATLQCTAAVAPGMKLRGFGRIVNIASRVALGRGGLTMYGASKAAVIGFTRGWALELARFGITVNCVAPGPIDTEALAETAPPGSDARENLLAGVPMGRVGLPQEVAAAVCYFTATDAGFTTGQTLYVCGGATVGLAGI